MICKETEDITNVLWIKEFQVKMFLNMFAYAIFETDCSTWKGENIYLGIRNRKLNAFRYMESRKLTPIGMKSNLPIYTDTEAICNYGAGFEPQFIRLNVYQPTRNEKYITNWRFVYNWARVLVGLNNEIIRFPRSKSYAKNGNVTYNYDNVKNFADPAVWSRIRNTKRRNYRTLPCEFNYNTYNEFEKRGEDEDEREDREWNLRRRMRERGVQMEIDEACEAIVPNEVGQEEVAIQIGPLSQQSDSS
jgi:hypothetical protein